MSLSEQLAMNMTVVVDPDRDLASVRRAAAFGKGYLQGILAIFFLPKNYQKILVKTPWIRISLNPFLLKTLRLLNC